MSLPRGSRPAGRSATSAALTLGVAAAAACFLLAGLFEAVGRAVPAAGMTDLAALFHGLTSWAPWAWAALGTYVVVVTPVVGLLVTAAEFRAVGDRRTTMLALAVIGVLGLSLAVSMSR